MPGGSKTVCYIYISESRLFRARAFSQSSVHTYVNVRIDRAWKQTAVNYATFADVGALHMERRGHWNLSITLGRYPCKYPTCQCSWISIHSSFFHASLNTDDFERCLREASCACGSAYVLSPTWNSRWSAGEQDIRSDQIADRISRWMSGLSWVASNIQSPLHKAQCICNIDGFITLASAV